MKNILIVFGTRPEAIKMAPLVKGFQKIQDKFKIIICVTAQHREMLDQVLNLFEIKPDYDLDIMRQNQDLYDITTDVLHGIYSVIKEVKPDIVLVHGDTTTSFASALAAFYKKIPVGHIEAGLRTYNIYSPFPEEINRQLTARLATYHFAPTMFSKNNLLAENIREDRIIVTGNTVIDALYWVLTKLNKTPEIYTDILKTFQLSGIPSNKIFAWQIQQEIHTKNNNDQLYKFIDFNKDRIHNIGIKPRKLILITGHRRENFGRGFQNICEAIQELATKFQDIDFVYPMHLNPNVRHSIKQFFGENSINVFGSEILDNDTINNKNNNIYFIEPLDYLPFVFLMYNSYLVLTDSGGIQEEAPGLGKPVLVMRNNTERPEALNAGTVKLVGTEKNKILNNVTTLINDEKQYNKMATARNPYGDGLSSSRIINFLTSLS